MWNVNESVDRDIIIGANFIFKEWSTLFLLFIYPFRRVKHSSRKEWNQPTEGWNYPLRRVFHPLENKEKCKMHEGLGRCHPYFQAEIFSQ